MKRKKTKNPSHLPIIQQENEPGKEKKGLSEKSEEVQEDIETDVEAAEPQQSERAEFKALLKENEELHEKVLRKMAELENYKKRAEKERSEAYITAKMHWAKELLPVMDNFERALSVPGGDEDHPIRKGIELIQQQFLKMLKSMGVTEIEALGEMFNPRFHEAIEIHKTDQFEKNIILDVKTKGYLLDGRLLRPSHVSVALSLNDSDKE